MLRELRINPSSEQDGRMVKQLLRFVDVKTKLTNYSVVPNDLYRIGISSTALVLYAKLLNRTNLSISNNRVDEFGRVYVL